MTGPAFRINAALQGRYRIERELGEGGMATVYLADDLKHERKVALKVLKPELAAVVGAERFLAEIKTTANLQHPHILPLFDSGEADSFLFYVMPYVEGETLRERIDREKQLSVDEAVAIATDVAQALHSAHEQGVIHRDIKPANILLSKGRPLVADFGIALAVSHAGGGRLTETGLSMGTPYYMSPEQASADREPTPASDVYSLGCVLYELLVGEPPYTGGSAQAVLAKILMGDAPAASATRSSIPANVDAAIRKALEKLPADRFTSAQNLAKALADPGFRYGETETVGSATGQGLWRRLTVGFAATATMLAALAAWGWLRPGPQPSPVTRAVIDLAELVPAGPQVGVIVSPDGSRFVLTGRSADGETALYWRDAGDESFRMIPGTEGVIPTGTAFSPDGEWIAYPTQNALLKVSLSGGAPTQVVPPGRGVPTELAWGDNGMIVFRRSGDIYLVSETGGEPELLLPGGRLLRNLSLLPGGWAVIGNRSGGGVMLLDRATGSMRELMAGGIDPMYVETGHLLYADDAGTLWAVPFDAARGEVLAVAVPVLDEISVGARGRFSVSRNGTLVYGAGGLGDSNQRQRLLVVDLESGNEESAPLEPQEFLAPRWSPDGESVAFNGQGPEGTGQSNIYIYDWALGAPPRRLTFEGDNRVPVWSPDGTRVAFASRGLTEGDGLVVKTVNDDAPPRMVLSVRGQPIPTDWPSDDLLVFEQGAPSDLWMVDPSADSPVARPYLESLGQLDDLVISPGGTAAAYVSDESGTFEVYVRSFPEPRQPEIVSQGGGVLPQWSSDGRTVFYWSLGPPNAPRSLIAARIERGPPFVVTSRDTVLTGRYSHARNVGGRDLQSHVHPDGTRLLVPQDVSDASADGGASDPERFIVVVNWFTQLRARMGEGN